MSVGVRGMNDSHILMYVHHINHGNIGYHINHGNIGITNIMHYYQLNGYYVIYVIL